MDGSESYYIGYDYDLDGIRTKKSVTVDSTGATTTHEYITQNGKIVRETMTSGTATRVFDFIYDENGRPFACKYTINGTTTTTMYYALNLQGDVVRILNANGSTMVKYAYNAWGEVISVTNANDVAITSATHIGNLNPLRYRGYYYDTETGFYYLQSRYYDPEIGRWINVDGQINDGILGTNLFVYCGNNPVDRIDSDGHAWSDIENWFSNTWGKVKKNVKQIVETVKEKAYSAYYNETKWHFEDRIAANGEHPTYKEVKKDSNWQLLPKEQSEYHDDNIGKNELKYIHPDGREAVFNGDTLEPMTDPQYMATYNYVPLYDIPDDANVLDYIKYGYSWIGHGVADVVPYWLTLNSNTREQFESKVVGIFS